MVDTVYETPSGEHIIIRPIADIAPSQPEQLRQEYVNKIKAGNGVEIGPMPYKRFKAFRYAIWTHRLLPAGLTTGMRRDGEEYWLLLKAKREVNIDLNSLLDKYLVG